MSEFKLTTPVAFIIFNRLDCTMKVFEQIRQAKPERLYIISDGPRENKIGEKEKVEEVRRYVEEHIDWQCQVQYNYADNNMGSKYRIYSGLNWVFTQEEETIVLEDDCVPSTDFFRYCQELLEIYCEKEQVWMISGINVLRKQEPKEPYFFARFSEIWGWATWKRAWMCNDIEMTTWPESRKNKTIKYAYDFFSYRCYLREADYQYKAKRDAWDIPWRYTMLAHHGVGIVPSENMIANIGCGRADASNTIEQVDTDFSYGKSLQFPLKEQEIVIDRKYDKTCLKTGAGVKKELRYIKYLFTRIVPKIKEKVHK